MTGGISSECVRESMHSGVHRLIAITYLSSGGGSRFSLGFGSWIIFLEVAWTYIFEIALMYLYTPTAIFYSSAIFCRFETDILYMYLDTEIS